MRWWPGERVLEVRLFNYFMPWLLLGLLPALAVAGLGRQPWLVMLLALPTVFICATFAPLFLPRFNTALAANLQLNVMSFNIWARNQDLDTAAALIRHEQPDILLLQEAYQPVGYQLIYKLNDLYPGQEIHVAYEPRMGQAVISRYPITLLEASAQKGRALKVLVETPDGPIAVWNVHIYHPFPWSRQYRQVSVLADDIAREKIPLIVGGDFNTTDQSETYQIVNQYLSNAHWEAGWGFGFSFPAHRPQLEGIPIVTPMLRIDHIFHSEHFYTLNARTLPLSGGSDHLPVVAKFSLVK